MFTLSILLMAVPTLAIGLLPTYASMGILAPLLLLLMRVLQGAAIGGEVPGAWVFVAEHVPARRIGIACGTLTAGLTVGILLGSVVATIVNTSMTQQAVHDWGWRIPFLLGGAFGTVAMYLRRWLQETPIFPEMQQRKALAQELPVKAVVVRHKRRWWCRCCSLATLGRDCGGDIDVSGVAAKAVRFRPSRDATGEQYRDNHALLWLPGRRAGGRSFRGQRYLYCRQPATGRIKLGVLPSGWQPS